MSQLFRLLKEMPFWRFVALFVGVSIVISELLIILQSTWLQEPVHLDHLIVGAITPASIASIISIVIAAVLERLRKAEQLYDKAQSIAQIGHWELDITTQDIRWSAELYRIMGSDPAVPVTITLLSSLVDPDDWPLLETSLSKSVNNGEPYDVEYRIKRPDGSTRWIHSKAEVHFNRQQKPVWLTGIAQDITDRKNTELALQESQQRLVLAGEAAYDLIYEWDVASAKPLWFGDVDRLLGYPNGALSQDVDAWRALIHPDDQGILVDIVQQHRNSTDPIEYQYRIRHRDGNYRYWIDYGLPLFDKNRHPYKWIGVCKDVTEQKQAEAALQERENFLRTVLDEMPDVVVLKDHKGDFLLGNQTVANFYGTTPEAMVGKDDGDFGVPKEMADFFRENVLSIMEKQETEIVFEDSRDAFSGEVRHFKSIKKPFKNAAGQNQILVIAHDISDIVLAQKKVAESEQRLRSILDNVDACIYLKDTKESLN